jgi:hypothetical protein
MYQKLNYQKLIDAKAYELGTWTNSLKQEVVFLEHPYAGDEYPVIISFPKYDAAFNSEFFEVPDMQGDYEPFYKNGKLVFAYEL